jgi:hypothetical protein
MPFSLLTKIPPKNDNFHPAVLDRAEILISSILMTAVLILINPTVGVQGRGPLPEGWLKTGETSRSRNLAKLSLCNAESATRNVQTSTQVPPEDLQRLL